MYMLLESDSPFMLPPMAEWREVYVILAGTQLSIHKTKTGGMFGDKRVLAPGKLLRKYTLQQAEIGLAADVSHSVLVPLTRMASLIPSMARRRAYEKDPHLFHVEQQYTLRMRAELDQFILSCPSEEQIFSWVDSVCASIDIAPPLDDRAVPRQCTMPRRRRRQQRVAQATDLTDRRLIEEQERILRSMYPTLASDAPVQRTVLLPPTGGDSPMPTTPALDVIASPMEQEQEDVDLSVIAEDAAPQSPTAASVSRRPTASRQITTDSVLSVSGFEDSSTDPINLDIFGKWNPPHPRTPLQQLRYIRRCMPLMFEDTPRHSSVLVSGGKYVRPNHRIYALEAWSLKPPSYEAHDFPEEAPSVLSRRTTIESVNSAQSRSVSGSSDVIQRADTPVQELQMVDSPQMQTIKVCSPREADANKRASRPVSNSQTIRKATQPSEMEAGSILIGF